jgi:uncharacterized protein
MPTSSNLGECTVSHLNLARLINNVFYSG